MASKATAAQAVSTEAQNDTDDALIDALAAAEKKLVAKGKEQGYLSEREIDDAIPPDRVNHEQREDILARLSVMGINVVDAEGSEEKEPESAREMAERKGNVADDVGRTDDPVRMYLREMGTVELLSREGEIEIAKRIEAGREKMIGGLCESPLTMRAVVAWRDALQDGDVLLRDIIDLEATFSGPAENRVDGDGADGEETDQRSETATSETASSETQQRDRHQRGRHQRDGQQRDGQRIERDGRRMAPLRMAANRMAAGRTGPKRNPAPPIRLPRRRRQTGPSA